MLCGMDTLEKLRADLLISSRILEIEEPKEDFTMTGEVKKMTRLRMDIIDGYPVLNIGIGEEWSTYETVFYKKKEVN